MPPTRTFGTGCGIWRRDVSLSLNPQVAAVNRLESRGTLYAVDNCQRVRTCIASGCLEAGIPTRRSSKLLLMRKGKAGPSSRSRGTPGGAFIARITTATAARFRSGAPRAAPAIMQGQS